MRSSRRPARTGPRSVRPVSRPSVRLQLEVLEDRLVCNVSIGVDAGAGQHAINPNVYGVAFADQATLLDLNVPLNRNGGNLTSRYNWQLDAANHANDYFYESLP